MSEQYAGLTLGVDVSQVDGAVKSLDNFARANEGAAKSVKVFVDQEKVARQRAKDASDEFNRQQKAFEGIASSIDPTVSKMRQLRKASEDLDKLWKSGGVPDKEFFRLGEVIETQMKDLTRVRNNMTESGREQTANEKLQAQQAIATARAREKEVVRAANSEAAAVAKAARDKAKAESDAERARQRTLSTQKAFVDGLRLEVEGLGKTRAELLEIKAAQMGVSAQAAPFIEQLKNQTGQLKLAGVSAGQYRQAMRMLPAQITDVVTSLASGMPVWMVAIQQGGQIKDSFGGIGNTFKVLASYINPLMLVVGALGGAFATAAYKVISMNKQLAESKKLVTDNLGMTGQAARDLSIGIYDIADATGKTVKEVSEMFIKSTDGADVSIRKLTDVGFSYKEASKMVLEYKETGDFTNLNQSIEEHKKKVDEIKQSWLETIPAMLNYNKAVNYSQSQSPGGGNLSVLRNALDLQETMNDLVKKGNQDVKDRSTQINEQYFQLNRVANAEKTLQEARVNAQRVSASGDADTIQRANQIVKIRERELEAAKKAERERDKPKKGKTSPIVKAPEEQLDKELYTLQAQLTVLKQHKEIGDKISSQRKSLWVTEATIANLQDVQGKRRLTLEEQALLKSQQIVLSKAQEKAELGDQIVQQEKMNALQDKSLKFVIDMQAATKALNDTRSMGNLQAQRETEKQKITSDWLSSGGKEGDSGLKKQLDEQDKYYAAEDAKRADWLAGAENAFANYGESATNMYSNVGQIATNALNGMSDMMTDFLMTGKANFADFAKSIISQIIKMITQMVIFNSISGMMGGGGGFSFAGAGKANGGVVGGTFAGGGYTGSGGKYQPAGVVHKGEFVMTKEATRRIGIANLYRLMRGYANGGAVGGGSGTSQALNVGGGGFSLAIGSIPIDINNGGDAAGMERGIRAIVTQMLGESCTQGGEIYNFTTAKLNGG